MDKYWINVTHNSFFSPHQCTVFKYKLLKQINMLPKIYLWCGYQLYVYHKLSHFNKRHKVVKRIFWLYEGDLVLWLHFWTILLSKLFPLCLSLTKISYNSILKSYTLIHLRWPYHSESQFLNKKLIIKIHPHLQTKILTALRQHKFWFCPLDLLSKYTQLHF